MDISIQTEQLYNICISKSQDTHYKNSGTKEVQHQKRIINFLTNEGFDVTKVIVANKAGTSDIVACSPSGRFWRVEVKRNHEKLGPLQMNKLHQTWLRNGVVLCAYGFDDFKCKYNLLTKDAQTS